MNHSHQHSCGCCGGKTPCALPQNYHFKHLAAEKYPLMAAGVLFAFSFFFNELKNIQFALCFLAWFLAGKEVLFHAVANFKKGKVLDENFLMTIATVGAFVLGQYPEAAAVMIFYQVGESFQEYAAGSSRRSIKALLDMRPPFARVQQGDKWQKVNPQKVLLGSLIAVHSGEKIPLDGTVIEGEAYVDTSALTGEAVPRRLCQGATALGGFICKDGKLIIKVLRPYDQSAGAKILQLVEHAASKKAKTESFISRFARWYTPLVVGAAVAVAVLAPLLLPGAEYKVWLYRALVFLVISCPCALVLSVPLGFFGGIGGMAKNGILVKGGNYLEALSRVGLLAADKTGTLTQGVFEVSFIKTNGLPEEELLEICALAEHASSHPIAKALLRAWGKELDVSRVSHIQETAGLGVSANVDGKKVLIGKLSFLQSQGVKELTPAANALYCAINGRFAGVITIEDKLKKDAQQAVFALKKQGVKQIVLLTGDNASSAKKICQEVGADACYADLLPADKVTQLEKLKAALPAKYTLAFAGDGINDAPVLARADVGIAMGALGSDAAVEAADVVLMSDEPVKIPQAVACARFTLRIVRQNIWIALGIKTVILLLGLTGHANLWEAVFADVGVSVAAVLNSCRPLTYKPRV